MPRAQRAVLDPSDGVPKRVPFRHDRSERYRKVGQRIIRATPATGEKSAFFNACAWIMPWSNGGYPGHVRGIMTILGRHVTWSAVGHWKRGHRRPAVWACRALQSYIRARCEVGLRLADELEVIAQENERQTALDDMHRAEVLSRHAVPHLYLPEH